METRRMEHENALDFYALDSPSNPKPSKESENFLFYRCFSID